MQGLQQSYTQRFNRRHEQVGTCSRAATRRSSASTDEYLVTLVRYVHYEPGAGRPRRPRGGLPVQRAPRISRRRRDRRSSIPTLVLNLVGGTVGTPASYRGSRGHRGYPAVVPTGSATRSSRRPRHAGGRPRWRSRPLRAPPTSDRLARGASTSTSTRCRGPDRSRSALSSARALAAFVLVRRLGYRLTDVASRSAATWRRRSHHRRTAGSAAARTTRQRASAPVERLGRVYGKSRPDPALRRWSGA